MTADEYRTERPEAPQARRRRRRRWVVGGVLIAGLAVGVWRTFDLICPTRNLQILKWTLEPATAKTWNEPQIPALVAENARTNGGAVGAYIGELMYAKTEIPSEAKISRENAWAAPGMYAKLGWMFYGMVAPVTWTMKPVPGHSNERYVDVSVQEYHSVTLTKTGDWYPRGVMYATGQYLVTDTATGWRVVSVSSLKDMEAPLVGEVPQHIPGT